MGAKFYNEGVLIFQKFGTRYFEKAEPILGVPKIVNPFYSSSFDWNQVKYVIIRNPKDVFISALHTEYFNIKRIGSSKIILERMLDVVDGGGHYHPKQNEFLYHYWCDYKFNTVHISDLSKFTKFITGLEITFTNSDTYLKFSEDITKEYTYDYFEKNNPQEMKKLLDYVEEDLIWYNRLIRKSRLISF